MSTIRKAVVAFAGARDHYQVPVSLAQHNFLRTFQTDIYYHPLLPFLKNRRQHPDLPENYVSSDAITGIYQLLSRFSGNNTWLRKGDRRLSRRAYQIAQQKDCNLFLYSYYAYDAFVKAKENHDKRHRILFQLHPHPISVRTLLQEEASRLPFTRDSLFFEHEMSLSETELQKLSSESNLATSIIATSSFTKRTLIANGCSEASVFVIPYGVDHHQFPEKAYTQHQKLNIVFVGSLIQRKGLADLLEALVRFDTRHYDLHLCGRGFVDQKLLQHYPTIPFQLHTNISHSELVTLFHQGDVFVLPSIAEGFGHVILEAMSSGLPVVVSTNTCGPDIVEDHVDGFIVSPARPSELANKIEWSLQNRMKLSEMGKAAANKARGYTWERFRKEIARTYELIAGQPA